MPRVKLERFDCPAMSSHFHGRFTATNSQLNGFRKQSIP